MMAAYVQPYHECTCPGGYWVAGTSSTTAGDPKVCANCGGRITTVMVWSGSTTPAPPKDPVQDKEEAADLDREWRAELHKRHVAAVRRRPLKRQVALRIGLKRRQANPNIRDWRDET